MRSGEVDAIAAELGRAVVAVRPLAGGFSRETCLLTLTGGDQIVVRLGGPPAIEGAVMARARGQVPVPRVLRVVAAGEGVRPAMILEYVAGMPLSDVLSAGGDGMTALGAEVGRVIASVGAVTFDRPGFFANRELAVGEVPPKHGRGPGGATRSRRAARLGQPVRRARPGADRDRRSGPAGACGRQSEEHPGHAGQGWRVDAVLDWEFTFSGCPYADAANMTRFSGDYPAQFTDGFRSGFARHCPDGLFRAREWAYLGHVLDMFALSDLVTRPPGHPVADQAARQIRRWIADGVPGAPG